MICRSAQMDLVGREQCKYHYILYEDNIIVRGQELSVVHQ